MVNFNHSILTLEETRKTCNLMNRINLTIQQKPEVFQCNIVETFIHKEQKRNFYQLLRIISYLQIA